MKARYRLTFRGIRGGMYYCVDKTTGKRTSLQTTNEDEARQIVEAKNNSERQPVLNLQIAKAYLAGSDNGINTRTCQQAIEALTNTKKDANKERWLRVVKDRALIPLLPQVIIETKGEALLKALHVGTVSTNVYLRRLHNFCVDMNWLPWPLIPKRQWPAVRFKDKRAITWAEHCKIVARELNPERKAFYQLAWHLGASQSDLAHLQAEDVDWQTRIICFVRMKTRWRGQQPPQIRFGREVEEILATLPKSGPLFPYLQSVRAGDRATEFKQRCVGLGIHGISLHSYRYAWAERAKTAGYPERYAQLALALDSKALRIPKDTTLLEYSAGQNRDYARDFSFCKCKSFAVVRIEDPFILKTDWNYKQLKRFLETIFPLMAACPAKIELRTRVSEEPDQKMMIQDLEKWLKSKGASFSFQLVPVFGLGKKDFHDRRLVFQPEAANAKKRTTVLMTGGIDRYLDSKFECSIVIQT